MPFWLQLTSINNPPHAGLAERQSIQFLDMNMKNMFKDWQSGRLRLQSRLRMDFNSRQHFAVVLG
jgi:hypothetical protein